MKASAKSLAVEWIVLAYCVWRAADLMKAWQHSPFDRLGWLAFVVWLAPVAWAWSGRWRRMPEEARDHDSSGVLPWLALLLTMVGTGVELNFLVYWGLALALGMFVRSSMRLAAWLALAVAWMPVLGWCARGLPVETVMAFRLGLALLGALVMFRPESPPSPRRTP